MSGRGADGRALWSSGFRPFFLLGALYGPLLALWWLGAELGAWPAASSDVPLFLTHGHELVFGFATAIVCGVLLTALPSWSGMRELGAPWLLVLAILWLTGRVSFFLRGPLPDSVVILGAGALLPVLGIFTPFCSCSAVPLFVGFVSAGVPLGVTFSFLIAAPMIN